MYRLLYVDERGRIKDHPDFFMLGRTGRLITEPLKDEMIPLPEGAGLFSIPGRPPLAADSGGKWRAMEEGNTFSSKTYAAAALLPQGFMRTLLPAYTAGKDKDPLPLFGYTAIGFKDDRIYAAAYQIDEHHNWHPGHYSTEELPDLILQRKKEFPGNRIIEQLALCAEEYACFTAQNIFYRRWEGGIPVSPSCNAGCLGCISFQSSDCCPSPQGRIDFVPDAREVIEIAAAHLEQPGDAVVSFGQGCEGEPSLQFDLLLQCVEAVRKRTGRGRININTNGSRPEVWAPLAKAGLNGIRVSLISAVPDNYHHYYRPRGYDFEDVCRTISEAIKNHLFVSLNYLVMPGFTDTSQEMKALEEFLKEYPVHMLQIRNLNLDPDLFFRTMEVKDEPLGMVYWYHTIKTAFPNMRIGGYTPLVF